MNLETTAVQPVPCTAAGAGAEITLRDDERQRCEVWTRVMGYHRPVASFNIGKQGEFHERVHFVEAGVQ
jgi:hypothetical protein